MITVAQLLEDARAGLPRLSPDEAYDAARAGASLIDIRSDTQRLQDGEIPCSTCVARNVLECRLDPACPYRDPELARRDRMVIVLCDGGYQSSLAAATLRRFGLDAADVVGGFQAWRAAGLPVERPTGGERDREPTPRHAAAGVMGSDREVARTALERVCSRADFGLAPDCYADDFVDHVNGLEFRGLEGVRRSTGLYQALFDELQIEVVDQVAEGDRVVSRWIMRGSNRGREVELTGITISRLRDGRIVEDWTATDGVDLLRGLGLLRTLLAAPRLLRAQRS